MAGVGCMQIRIFLENHPQIPQIAPNKKTNKLSADYADYTDF
jgi:hypothetical protein